MCEKPSVTLAPGTSVVTSHGKHRAFESGVIVKYKHSQAGSDWYEVALDCGCCTYSLDLREDGYGRIRVVE